MAEMPHWWLRGQREMARRVWAHRKAPITQMITLYNHGWTLGQTGYNNITVQYNLNMYYSILLSSTMYYTAEGC